MKYYCPVKMWISACQIINWPITHKKPFILTNVHFKNTNDFTPPWNLTAAWVLFTVHVNAALIVHGFEYCTVSSTLKKKSDFKSNSLLAIIYIILICNKRDVFALLREAKGCWHKNDIESGLIILHTRKSENKEFILGTVLERQNSWLEKVL